MPRPVLHSPTAAPPVGHSGGGYPSHHTPGLGRPSWVTHKRLLLGSHVLLPQTLRELATKPPPAPTLLLMEPTAFSPPKNHGLLWDNGALRPYQEFLPTISVCCGGFVLLSARRNLPKTTAHTQTTHTGASPYSVQRTVLAVHSAPSIFPPFCLLFNGVLPWKHFSHVFIFATNLENCDIAGTSEELLGLVRYC